MSKGEGRRLEVRRVHIASKDRVFVVELKVYSASCLPLIGYNLRTERGSPAGVITGWQERHNLQSNGAKQRRADPSVYKGSTEGKRLSAIAGRGSKLTEVSREHQCSGYERRAAG